MKALAKQATDESPKAIPNPNKVPQALWKRWDEPARYRFNDMFAYMNRYQKSFTHPKAPKIEDEHWTTIAWNAAVTAAEVVREQPDVDKI
jgi:hypothetical protein